MHTERWLLHIEEDQHRIFEWCCNNSLLVNPEKTKMMVVGTRQGYESIDIFVIKHRGGIAHMLIGKIGQTYQLIYIHAETIVYSIIIVW